MEQYIKLYNEIKPILEKQASPVLNAEREKAIATFKRLGFPTKQTERYRYTDVAASFAPDYGISLAPLQVKDVPYVSSIKDADDSATKYYNKVIDSAVTSDGKQTKVSELKGEYEQDALTALNTAIAHDAVVIHLPKNTQAKTPIRIENTLSGLQDTMAVRRILIVMEECSEATIFLVDHIANDNDAEQEKKPSYLTLQVIEVVCKDGAHLDMYEFEETNEQCHRFSNLYIKADRDASVRHNNITISNGITRNETNVYLQGCNAEATLNGAVIADRNQHVDNNTLIDHQVPQCTSNELYKYVLDDEAIAAFAGKIMVRDGAQQTSSQETNNNMVASNDAKMYTQPMLEIYADDVKCAHGSTVGVMDDAALFYMQQRGIPVDIARMLLKNAFISQVIDEMHWEAFRDRLHILVDKRLSKGERCGACKICK